MVLRQFCSMDIQSPDDMARLEETIGELLGCEHHKCAFVRSEAFVRLRLRALYHRCQQNGEDDWLVSAFWEGLKVTLTPGGTVIVYVTEPCVEETPEAVLRLAGRKRSLMEAEEEETGPGGV
jgi:hypothetical protein